VCANYRSLAFTHASVVHVSLCLIVLHLADSLRAQILDHEEAGEMWTAAWWDGSRIWFAERFRDCIHNQLAKIAMHFSLYQLPHHSKLSELMARQSSKRYFTVHLSLAKISWTLIVKVLYTYARQHMSHVVSVLYAQH
jgi:hypothetical protein